MKKLLLLFAFIGAFTTAFAQPTITGTSKLKFIENGASWEADINALAAYLAAGGGTVYNVTVTPGNGFSGVVTDPTGSASIALSTTINGIPKGNGTAFSVATPGTDYVIPSGSVATLSTPRSIYGNNFDGSANLAQIIASTFGGTGNGFTKFTGATSTEKTYTLPNSSATILTSAAAVTPAQGGLGLTSYTIGDIVYASGATTLAKLADIATGNVLLTGGVGVAPSYGKVGLTTHVTGVLPETNGGTGLAAVGSNSTFLISNGSANLYASMVRTNNSAAIGWVRNGATVEMNLPDANASFPGIVNTGAQTIAGAKTFTGAATVQGLATTSAGLVATATSSNASIKGVGVQSKSYTEITTGITADHTHSFIGVGTLSGNITIALPACDATHNEWEYHFSKLGTDAFAFILDPSGAETFTDGDSTKSVYSQGNSLSCKCRSSDSKWILIR